MARVTKSPSADGMKKQIAKTGGGKQDVRQGGDFGAHAMFKAADSPASVRAMVSGEKAKYKHDKM